MKLLHWIHDLTTPTFTEESPEEPPLAPVLKARLLELEKMTVAQIMIPRSVIMALDVDVQLRRVRRLKSSKTLHFPVYKGDLDHILGWISKQKVLELLNEPAEDLQITNHLKPVGEVSEATTVDKLADAFLQNSSPFLVVKNSQGSTTGIVPLAEFVELVFGIAISTTTVAPPAEFSTQLLRSHEI